MSKLRMGKILGYTLNYHFDGSSCSESRSMILNRYSSNLDARSNYFELYFLTVTSKTYLKH